MFNEFPTRNASIGVCDRESAEMIATETVPTFTKVNAPKKKQVSPKKVVPEAAAVQEAPKKIPAPLEIATEAAPEAETQMVPEAVRAPVSQEEVSVPPVVQETPRKRTRGAKKEQEVVTPATPATSAGPETPASASSPASTPEVTVPKRSLSLKPILSDSSDDECPLLNKAAPLTRTITPVSVKPSVVAKEPVASAPVASTPEAEPSSESEVEQNNSSSSDSDADVPSASLIAAAKRKKATKTKPAAEPSPAQSSRMGPLVQVENADESHIETIHKNILEMIPEPLRNGAIKEAVADEANKRLIFQLRMNPKVVQFITAAGGNVKVSESETRDLVVLSEAQKKKAAGLFKAAPADEEKAAKRRR